MTREQEARIEAQLGELQPGQQLRLAVDEGHEVLVMLTNEVGFHSGRKRYLVVCVTCEELLHEATTGPIERMRMHTRYEWEKREQS